MELSAYFCPNADSCPQQAPAQQLKKYGQSQKVGTSKVHASCSSEFLNSYIAKKYPNQDIKRLNNRILDLKQILASSITKDYKTDLLNKMKNEGILNRLEEHNMFILRINKDDIIESNDIEESIFSISTPLPKDYTESRFIIFSFESGYHGRVIDGSTSWSE